MWEKDIIEKNTLNLISTHLIEIVLLVILTESFTSQQYLISFLFASAVIFFSISLVPLDFSKGAVLINKNIIINSKKSNYLNNTTLEKITFSKKQQLNSNVLTDREYEILDFLALGLTSKEISEKMYLSKKTIDHYRAAIKEKLGYEKRSELVEFALSRTDSAILKTNHKTKTAKILQE